MTAPGFLIVSEQTARNPVARAIARARVQQAVRDFSTRLYMLQHDEYVAADVQACSHVLMVACNAAQLMGQADSAQVRIMAGGMGALAQISERGWRWRTLDAVAIDRALQEATQVYATAPADVVRRAWSQCMEGAA